jgi:4a-hydroxytetrahydrobiopterin dehydratase
MHTDDLLTLLQLSRQGAPVEELVRAGWRLEGRALTKTWDLPGDRAPEEAFIAVWALAKRHRHHPDVTARYGALRVALTTHDAGGLTALDVALAAEIEALELS